MAFHGFVIIEIPSRQAFRLDIHAHAAARDHSSSKQKYTRPGGVYPFKR